MYKRKLLKNTDQIKHDIYESRYQASLDKAMTAKKQIKNLEKENQIEIAKENKIK